MVNRTGRTATRYRGHLIIRCNLWWMEKGYHGGWRPGTGRHRGGWYIQTYHSPTGMPWSDEECPHFDSIAGARNFIREGVNQWQ